MYCSNCGNQVREGLNYCNQCGGMMQTPDSPEKNSIAKSLSSSLGYIGFAGFLTLAGILAMLLKRESLDPGAIVGIIFLFLAALTTICYLILRQISKLADTPNKSNQNTPNYESPQELNSANANLLHEARERPASVVENTTRTLDKVPVERK
ncbi:MAG: hypothetical protein KDB79_06695 [Acidobacteria bacterium]|nr:hypothetical protein [Acidobacteriota bacterium]